MEDVLDRDHAISRQTTPTGRKLKVFMEEQYGLYRVGYDDGKQGDLPDTLKGRWTKGELARAELLDYLKMMWDMNDKVAEKNRLKAHREKNAESQPTSSG